PLLACLIVAPQRGYDEPAILSYVKLSCARPGSSCQIFKAGNWLKWTPGISAHHKKPPTMLPGPKQAQPILRRISSEREQPCTRSCDLPCWRFPWRCRRRRRKRESSSSARVTFPAASGPTRQKTQPSTTC